MLGKSPTFPIQSLMLVALITSAPVQSGTLEENILVTASRVEENAMKLPLAWSTVNSETLALIDPIHINEVMQRVPGAWISRGNGQESIIALRSPVLTGAGGCGVVRVIGWFREIREELLCLSCDLCRRCTLHVCCLVAGGLLIPPAI